MHRRSSSTSNMWPIIRRQVQCTRHPISTIGNGSRHLRRNLHNDHLLQFQARSSSLSSPLTSSRTSFQDPVATSSRVVKDPDNWRSQLLYVNSSLCVLNKRPGIAVHTGTNQHRNNLSTLMRSLEQYLHQLDQSSTSDPTAAKQSTTATSLRLVHRLDKDTSGCLMLARTRQTAQLLSELLQREGGQDSDELLVDNIEDKPRGGRRKQTKQTVVHSIQSNLHQIQPRHHVSLSSIPSYSPQVWSFPFLSPSSDSRSHVDSGVQKRYLAIVHGIPERKEGAITSIISADGKQAVSSYRTLASVSFVAATTSSGGSNNNRSKPTATPVAFSLLQLMPHTGRKRQLRLHCFHDLHCSIVGEKLSHVVGDSKSDHTTSSGRNNNNSTAAAAATVWTKSHSMRQERMQHVESQLWKFVNDQARDSSIFQTPFIPSSASTGRNIGNGAANSIHGSSSGLPLLLHAHELFVLHPKLNDGRTIHVTAPLPRNFYRAVKALFGENVIPATKQDLSQSSGDQI